MKYRLSKITPDNRYETVIRYFVLTRSAKIPTKKRRTMIITS
jgi:hypothetical protein